MLRNSSYLFDKQAISSFFQPNLPKPFVQVLASGDRLVGQRPLGRNRGGQASQVHVAARVQEERDAEAGGVPLRPWRVHSPQRP